MQDVNEIKSGSCVRAQKQDIILFAVACILLLCSIGIPYLIGILNPIADYAPGESGNQTQAQLPGSEMVDSIIIVFYSVLIGLAMAAVMLLCSLSGCIIFCRLFFTKKEMPRWLKIFSVVLAAVSLVPTAWIILSWIL